MKNIFLAIILAAFFVNLNSQENLTTQTSLNSNLDSQIDNAFSFQNPQPNFQFQNQSEYFLKDKNLKLQKPQIYKGSETSSFERFVGVGLEQFGYNFFYNAPSSFIPDQNIPVTPDYIIGPGDEIIITLWGRINAKWNVQVSRDGTISLPKIGVINLTGIQFKDLQNFLKKEISRYYTDFDLNVSMGNLRSIRVYIVGNAKNPGAYTISGLSTIISALFESGGPSKTGSLRNIELKRDGKTIATLDLYDLFLKGDKSKDLKLINEDVIFIPPVGNLVAINGEIQRPAIYEIKQDEKLFSLINMAGGFTNTAYTKKASIKRIFNNEYVDYLDVDISNLSEESDKNIKLNNGDIISINSVIEKDSSINISGAVAYPGKIGINRENLTLTEAIKLSGGVLTNASDEVEITRFYVSSSGVKSERFNLSLKKALSGDEKHNIILKPYDSIIVKSIPDWYIPETVELSGEVISPGSYVIQKGERLYSVLKRAGGFTKRAFPQGIIFIRESVRQEQQKNIDEMVNRLEKELFSQSTTEISSSLSTEEIQSKKEIFQQKQKFLEQLKKAKATGRVYIKLTSLEELKDSNYNIELQKGDKIIIPTKPDVVNVFGAVMAGGSYVYKNSNYKTYIEMAGGYSYYSDKGRTFILRADGSAVKAKSFLFFHTKVKPGDTIIVPEKFESIAWLREIRDITQIITNLALSAGVVIKVF